MLGTVTLMDDEAARSPQGPDQHLRSLIGDGVLVGAASAIAVAQAYSYDRGVCMALGLPGWMARAGVAEIMNAAAISFILLALANQLVPKFLRRVRKSVVRDTSNHVRAASTVRLIVCLSLAVPSTMHAAYFSASTSLLAWVVFLAFLFVRPFATDARWSYWAAFFRRSLVFRLMRTPPALPWRMTSIVLFLGAFCLASISVARGLGWLSALKGDAYLVLANDPGLVLVRESGDYVVLCKPDVRSMSFSGEFVILSKADPALSKGFRHLDERISPAPYKF